MIPESQETKKKDLLAFIQNARRERCKKLDMSDWELMEIPAEIGQLESLEFLGIRGNQLKVLPPELGNLSNLKVLDVSWNHLTSVPNELGQLSNLIELSFSHNYLVSIPKELGQLSNLIELSLSYNQLTSVPKELGQINSLKVLPLSQNQLTSVPKELGYLTNLTRLYLTQNQLASVPKELGQLTKLTRLYISQNRLTSIPKELSQLVSLTRLYISQNRLTDIPKELGKLENLTQLDASQNQLVSVPKELGKLSSLTVLSLDQNRLESVPKELGQLAKLTELSLDHNLLTSVPDELSHLNNLQTLLLHENKKLDISDEILGHTNGKSSIGVNPTNPKDFFNYYSRIQEDSQPLNEAKLILVGFGSVGKTSIASRLVHDIFDTDSKKTEGIQISQWVTNLSETEDATLRVWDFGGQEIMHSTHQFFFTERSLYLLVLNGRQGHEDADAAYWLELVQSFGGNSPILVVLNKIKEQPFDVNRRALKQKFPAICRFIQTDCEAGIGIEQLRKAIEQATSNLENLRVRFPASWMKIKAQLSCMTADYISFEQYRSICRENGEPDREAQDSLAVHLNNLGIALNYKNDPRLRDTHILNPRWVTKGIYALLNSHMTIANKGELELADVNKILSPEEYPAERHGFLLDLMRKFNLCFRFEEEETRYLIPDLLDKQQPIQTEEFKQEECLNFDYDYPVLAEGLLPRFIVRTHILSERSLRWRTGVILRLEGNNALVKGDIQARRVTISVDGPLRSRRRLLAVIRSDFERIHSSFKSKPEELVPVPGHPSVTVRYKDLLLREEKGRTSFEKVVEDELVDIDVQGLLNGVDIEGSRQKLSIVDKRNRPLRLFYSYSHRDEHFCKQLDTHLKILERQQLIRPWHDRQIVAGEEWEKEIDKNLEQADIILLLISADFIASDYCYDKELAWAMQRHSSTEDMAQVIPIILRPVDWSGTPFSKLQVLPRDAMAVTEWRNPDAAWLNVESGIKETIELIKAKHQS